MLTDYLGLPIYLFIFWCGAILGSFLNSWMWRTRENIRIFAVTRSVCVNCHRQLAWYENIPLVSFMVLKHHCRSCGRPIPWQYFLVEFATGLLLTAIFYYHVHLDLFNTWQLWRDIFFLALLIIIFFYDYNYGLVLSRVVWLGVVIGGLINYYALGLMLGSMITAAVVTGGFFLLQYLVSRGRWIGGGDVRLGVLMGIWLGWPTVLVALFIAYILGAFVSVSLLISKKSRLDSALPFGTFLALGTLVSLYGGDRVVAWYSQLIGW